jgi:D-alanine-D-alanine ligase
MTIAHAPVQVPENLRISAAPSALNQADATLELSSEEPDKRHAASLRIALIVSSAKGAPQVYGEDLPPDVFAELDSEKSVKSYKNALLEAGHDVFVEEGSPHLAGKLDEAKPDICFNVCEGFRGDSREAQVPALLEMMALRYTGPTPLAAAITHDKPTTKRILAYYGLPTPLFQVFQSPSDTLRPDLKFPLFAKPAHEGTGMGINNRSVSCNERELREYVDYLIKAYKQPALVETYIEGKDITCGLVGNGDDVHFFPITEVDFTGYPDGLLPIYGSQQKVDYDDLYRNKCPAPLGEAMTHEIRRLTHQTFLVTGARDFGRVDFRIDEATNQPYILEINALPGITPRSDLTLMAEAEGWTHSDLVRSVLKAGLRRYGMRD